MRALRALVVVILAALVLRAAAAAEERVEGMVQAVSAEKQTLTVLVAGKERTFDVLKKARIKVNGKEASLPGVRKGQKVVLLYNPELEVVAGIEATGDAAADPELVALKELPAGQNSGPWPSPDGLTLYWQSNMPGERQRWIWCAERKDRDSLFEKPRKLVPGNDPTASGSWPAPPSPKTA